MTEIKAEELLPAVLDAISTRYPARSLAEAKLVYGPELTTPSHSLQYMLRGHHDAKDVIRWWQVNQAVSSGTTPAGTDAGFGERHRKYEKRVKDLDEQYAEGPLEDLMECTPLVSARRPSDTLSERRRAQTLILAHCRRPARSCGASDAYTRHPDSAGRQPSYRPPHVRHQARRITRPPAP